MHVAKPSVWSQLGHRARVRFSLGISYLGVYYLSLIWFRNVPNQFSIPCYPRQKRADMRSCRSLKMRAFYTIDFYLSLLHDFWHFTFQTLPFMYRIATCSTNPKSARLLKSDKNSQFYSYFYEANWRCFLPPYLAFCRSWFVVLHHVLKTHEYLDLRAKTKKTSLDFS